MLKRFCGAATTRFALVLGVAVLLGMNTLSATPITGRLIMNGTSLAGVDLNTVDFNYSGSGPALGTTVGTFGVGFGSTQTFGALVGTNGSVRSFTRSVVPVGTAVNYDDFITFAAAANIDIVLTELIPGSFGSAQCGAPAAPGQTCTPSVPGGSAIELSNSSNGMGGLNAHAAFNVDVSAINTLTHEVSTGVGTFSADFSNTSYQALLATIAGGGVVTSGHHGDFTITFSQVPEPQTTALVLGGLLIMLGRFGMRRYKRSS
jgi:hypothetical protein